MRIALGIEYDGSQYYGWQKQPHRPSVQACVEHALSRVADAPVEVFCAGRTDRGVHATAQVIHFVSPTARPQKAWVLGGNANLPRDIRISWAQEMDDQFHARFSATRRRYCYLIYDSWIRPGILRHGVTWHYGALNLDTMQAAAQYFLGEQDFSAVRAAQCQSNSPCREVFHLNITRAGRLVMIDIMANAFLHHMVRNIAGILMCIGEGKHPPAWAKEVLAARDRRQAPATASEQGLYLIHVGYPQYAQILQEPVFPLFLVG